MAKGASGFKGRDPMDRGGGSGGYKGRGAVKGNASLSLPGVSEGNRHTAKASMGAGNGIGSTFRGHGPFNRGGK